MMESAQLDEGRPGAESSKLKVCLQMFFGACSRFDETPLIRPVLFGVSCNCKHPD
jgi:hypothetical protein